ncbi:ATP-binding protein [Candidatus Gracilibacteria bacterium]|nr:ATP-binding protein [Candidatus Gracilibacteria bacterium]
MNQVGSGEATGMNNHFRGLFDLSEDLQSRLKKYREELGENRLPEVAFISEPPSLDSDIQKVGEYLARVNHAVPNYRDKHSPGAHYFLSSLLKELSTIKDIHKSPDYLRFIGEWIGAANQSADYLSVKKRIPKIISLIEYHTNIVTSGKDIFADNLEVSDDNIFIYRDKLLNIIVNLAFFYSHICDYTELSRLTKIGSKIATLFGSAQIKFDIIILELGALLTRGISDDPKIDTLVTEAHAGIVILEEVYSEKAEYAVHNERNKNQLAVLELFLTMKRSDLSDISQIADLFGKRDELFDHKKIDDSIRQGLIHMEIILSIAFKDLLKDTTNVAQLICDKNKDFQYLRDRCELSNSKDGSDPTKYLDKDGSDLNTYLNKSNARLFLAPLIELYKFKVAELDDQKHPGETKRDKAKEMMLTIYRLAVGVLVGDKNENREIFRKLSFFQSFILNSKLLMLSDEEQNSIISEDVILRLIEKKIEDQDKLAESNYKGLINKILTKWQGFVQIASIGVSRFMNDKVFDTTVIYNNTINALNYTCTFDKSYEGNNYRFTVVVNDVPIRDDQLQILSKDVSPLLPYIQKANTKKLLDQTLLKLRHDFLATVPRATQFGQMARQTIGEVQMMVSELMKEGGTGINSANLLRLITEKLAAANGYLVDQGYILSHASGFTNRLTSEINGIMDGSNSTELDKTEILIENFLETASMHYVDDIDIQFVNRLPALKVCMNRDYFTALFSNILQNVIRYKKPDQPKGILKISLRDYNDRIVIMFQDFGIGMSQARIDEYLSGKCTPSEYIGSQGLGSQNVVDIVKKHGWQLVISSNYGNKHGQPVNTSFVITIPYNKVPVLDLL